MWLTCTHDGALSEVVSRRRDAEREGEKEGRVKRKKMCIGVMDELSRGPL